MQDSVKHIQHTAEIMMQMTEIPTDQITAHGGKA